MILLEDHVVPLIHHLVLSAYFLLQQFYPLISFCEFLLVLFQLIFHISKLLSHLLVVAQLIMELNFVAVLLVLQFQDLHLQGLDLLILYVLYLKQRHIGLLLQRYHLVLHLLLVIHIATLDFLQSLELLSHFSCILFSDFGDILMVALL